MTDNLRSKEDLLNELAYLRRRNSELEASLKEYQKSDPQMGQAEFNDINRDEKLLLRSKQREELVACITSRLLSAEDPQVIIDDLCQKTMEHLECDVFFNYLVDQTAGRLHLNAWAGIPGEEAANIEWLDYGVAVCGCAALEGCRIVAENIPATPDPRTDLVRSYGILAYACHPLMIEGKVTGTISFGTRSRPGFTEEELQLMKIVADHIAIAMNRLFTTKELHYNEARLEVQVRNRTQELEEILHFTQSILEISPFGIAVYDSSGQLIIANETCAKILGASKEQLLSLNYTRLESWKESGLLAIAQQVLESGIPVSDEIYYKTVSGKKVWLEGTLCRFMSGQEPCLLLMFNDISERTQIYENLKKSEKEKTNILNSITDAFFTLDSQWQVTYWNSAAQKMFNINPKEILGRSFWEVFPRAVESDFYNYYNYAMKENQPVAFETRGGYTGLWVEARAYPSESGLTIYLHDISERKLAEQVICQSEQKFSRAFHGLPIMIAIGTLDEGRFIDVNKAFSEETGYAPDDIIGKTSLDIGFFLDYKQRINHFSRLREHGTFENREMDIVTKSGEVRTCLVCSQFIEMDGENCHISGLIDLTEKNRMEQAISRLDRLNLIGEMAASIGHEIRNPMTTVRGFMQLLRGWDNNPEWQEYANLIIEELDRANSIISEFLSLAKDKSVNLREANLNKIISAILPLVTSDSLAKDMNVVFKQKPVPSIRLDESEIRQLILNLSRNALEAMSPGGTVTISTHEQENSVVLSIQDQGCGISEEVMAKLGTPFMTTKDEGTGLGLAVCYSIAERHGAWIDVQSSHEGTKFVIHFPKISQPSLF